MYISLAARTVRRLKKRNGILMIFACVSLTLVFVISLFSTPKAPAEVQGFAMGSPVKITVYGEKGGEEKAKSALENVKQLDRVYLSHTLPSAYAYKLNSERAVEADDYFKNYLSKCIELSSDSDGFTLFSGRLKALWKTEDGGYVPAESEINEILSDLRSTRISIGGSTASISGNGLLDMGALGKGTACQTAIDELKQSGVKNALCTVGGTVGVIGAPKKNEKFKIAVRNPFGGQNEYFGTLSVTDCFVSTSGDYEKYFERDGVRYSHIFDARTGKPVNNNLTSVTVIAADGTASDFLSTAVFILGEEKGEELAEKYGAQYILVRKDKTVIMSKDLKSSFELTDENFTVIS